MPTLARDQIARLSRNGPVTIFIIALGVVVLTLAVAALGFGGEIPESRGGSDGLPLPLVIHLATVIPALPLGAYVLLRRKGDRLHKFLGRAWALMMVTTAIASFWVGSGLSFIHIFSVTTLISIPLSIWRIWVGDVAGHRRAMAAVYIGLVIAGAFTFVPGRLLGALLYG
jgi:uncharacterized membrane protein